MCRPKCCVPSMISGSLCDFRAEILANGWVNIERAKILKGFLYPGDPKREGCNFHIPSGDDFTRIYSSVIRVCSTPNESRGILYQKSSSWSRRRAFGEKTEMLLAAESSNLKSWADYCFPGNSDMSFISCFSWKKCFAPKSQGTGIK